jgi:hypothetical protein
MKVNQIGRRHALRWRLGPLLAAAATTAALAVPTVANAAVADRADTATTLPMITAVRADGSILKQADPKALQALIGTAAAGCGNTCDGQNPASFVWNGAPCGNDAQTVREAHKPGGGSDSLVAELRYSPRCRTAWTRGKNLYHLKTTSYYTNGNVRTNTFAGRNPNDPGGSHFTAMVNDAGLVADGCASFDSGDVGCTSRY